MIYADNAATTKMSEAAYEAMKPFLTEKYGNCSSLYTFGQLAKEDLENFRARIAKCLNAEPNEIYFTSGGSEADNQAIFSAVAAGEKKGKKHIITSAFEHHAVLHPLERLKKQGYEITYLPVYENGVVKPEDVKKAIREDTCLVTVMTANNEIGTIQPIAEIGKICREKKVPFHTDAVQAVGHIPVDVKAMNVDMLSLSAHKFHGPKGVGLLFARRGVVLSPLISGGAQEKSKRAGTENLAGIAGMCAALEEACEKMNENAAKITPLRDKLIRELSKVPHSKVNGDLKSRVPNNVNICFEGVEGESLLLLMDMKGICASSGSACTSGSLDPSHVLLAIGLPHEVAHGSLRLSLSEDNTEADVDAIISAVNEIIPYLRKMSPVWDELEKGELKHVI